MSKEAMKLALDALKDNQHLIADNERHAYVMEYNAIIEKLKEALKQEQSVSVGEQLGEHVAWIDNSGHPKHISHVQSISERKLYGAQRPLYTKPQPKQEQGEHYKGVIEGVQKLFDDKRKAKQEHGEAVAATDSQISYEAYIEDPEDWNDLNFKECWHKGFAAGFKAAETFHKIGVNK
jgi:hypothetical protein